MCSKTCCLSLPSLAFSPHCLQPVPNICFVIQAVIHHKTPWMQKWAAFRRWIGADPRKHCGHEVTRGSSESQLSGTSDAERSQEVKIYIPYESAELCVTQITEDMEAMRRRHLEVLQDLEENFEITARENQVWTVHRIRSHYQNKLNTVRRILDLYQDKVERKNADCERRVAALTAQNEQLLEEQRAERRRSKEEALQWDREKSKMLELFSNRLDVLHSHQASTLQELQMARQEVGKVQEMLMVSSQEATEESESSENKGLSAQQQTVACNESDQPLEGAKARLEELKESLYQREREITELLEAEGSPVPNVPPVPPVPPVPQPPCGVLLPTVILKVLLSY
uniref:GRIP and coiled-coil domain-containing protein 1 n=1 Tax=Scatophagus argus TaxID=75038 RepID=UPI001ED7E0DF|nr:GRIP and coiled-coil domain-containing protein 1 [Scatophagus argus]XP_046242844.1 GRIP and coiled-coil domain-containing protein 1 [Scatophagus argus]XP_046242845.1 GRIP and coiled-coil domain-containing protein 1 [Scatophagus argus]XP_046242846.1 GRIP and coiled-coil domain-containing protein 1 [Scatophagus argus]XP_046242848.1 GRIP and coiled-coil domain-containing protein 1 [Scatophagus argus]XP_046242849.1 GRIP and coiled-coil domain-containing protein 1 [Scatophagus argus]XP_04624285